MIVYYHIITDSFYSIQMGLILNSHRMTLADILFQATNKPVSIWAVPGTLED